MLNFRPELFEGPLAQVGAFISEQLVHLRPNVPRRALPGRKLFPVALDCPGVRRRQVIPRLHRREECLKPVIVRLQDRVELVVVAAGAADRQAQEDLAGDIGHVVENLLPPLFKNGSVVFVGPEAIEAGGNERLSIPGLQLITSELLTHKMVKRHVLIQRLDHVIAVLVGERPKIIRLEAVGFRIAHPYARLGS